jgi:prophage maintenance system killer protein
MRTRPVRFPSHIARAAPHDKPRPRPDERPGIPTLTEGKLTLRLSCSRSSGSTIGFDLLHAIWHPLESVQVILQWDYGVESFEVRKKSKMVQSQQNSKELVVLYINSERARWEGELLKEDVYGGSTTISLREVLDAHFLLAEYFAKSGEGLGGLGPKEPGLLHSALNRQFAEFGGIPRWNNRIQVCASLMFGLIRNHPFHDANKRTAFLVSLLHLQKIGRAPTMDQKIYEDFTVDIADRNLKKYRKTNYNTDHDEEISIIADFLRRNTREIDLHMKHITYNELDRILHGYGMLLANPKGNRIDLIRARDPATQVAIDKIRLARIGFHGWSKQVSAKDIHIVRDAAKLDARHGYDSQSFFNGVESPLSLINRYRDPLERLAYR